MKTFKNKELPYAVVLTARRSYHTNDVIWVKQHNDNYEGIWSGRNGNWYKISSTLKDNPNNWISYESILHGEEPEDITELTADEFGEFALLNIL